MLKLLHTITFFCLLTTGLTAQINHLTTQEQVNNFQIAWGGVQFIIGPDSCCSDITDLSPLSNVEAAGWLVKIQNNPHLKSLHGLENLMKMDSGYGHIAIINNDSLLNLVGLADSIVPLDPDDEAVFGIGYDIIGNDMLDDLSGIPDCRESRIYMANNSSIRNLNGCENWDRISTLYIDSCSNLVSLKGLEAIESIDDTMFVKHCLRLKNLKGLDSCSYISDIHLLKLDSLENTDGLDNLRYTHSINIDSCTNFRALTKLERLGRSSYSNDQWIELNINNCRWFGDFTGLSDTARFEIAYISKADSVETIVDFHRLHTNHYLIWDSYNLKYLNSLPIGVNHGSRAPSGGVQICPNLEFIYDTISGRLDSMSYLFISGPKLTDVSGFGYVRRVTEYLYLIEITNDSFTGTENLQKAKNVVVTCTLKTLNCLSSLDSVYMNLHMHGNISSLEGLQNLNYVGAALTIGENDSLRNLTPISDSIRIGLSLSLTKLNNLDTISGFENYELLGYKAYGIWIDDCNNLKSITGFNSITSFPYANNPNDYDNIRISNNPLLESVTGFQSLNYLKKRLTIQDNPMLSDISGFCNLFQNGTIAGGSVILDNAPGANSLSEALAACISDAAPEPVNEAVMFDLYPNPASDQIVIRLNENLANGVVYIQDITGRMARQIPVSNQQQYPIDCTELQEGVYVVTLVSQSHRSAPVKMTVVR